MVNSRKIKERMKECSVTQVTAAKHLELSQAALNQKINNIRRFNLDEAGKLAKLLHIGSSEFCKYFLEEMAEQ